MVILGLGGNVGCREFYMRGAIERLSGIVSGLRQSRVLESRALPCKAPVLDGERDFLNMVVCGDTALSPRALLSQVKAFEAELGRLHRGVWGPREIDIDILCYDGRLIEEEGLRIPHPEMLNRDFVLVPLQDVAPQWRFLDDGPFHGCTAAEICAAKGYGLGPGLRETGIHFDG